MKFKKIILPSGLRVIMAPSKESPTATALVLVAAGSKYEDKRISGLSHFLEHVCFKGTTKRPSALEITRELDGLGAQFNAFTSQEYTGYFAKAEASRIHKLLDIVSDLYLNPTFDAAEVEKEKGVIVQEINMYEDMPMRHVHDIFMGLMYGDQPAGWNIAGTPEIVRTMTREDFIAYRKAHYVASATTVIVAGGFDEKKILKEIKEKFSAMPAGKKKGKIAVNDAQKKTAIFIKHKETDQTHLILGMRSKKVSHKDSYALDVLASVLGGGMSSRLFQKIRDEMGAAYYVRAWNDAYTDHGIFGVSVGAGNEQAKDVIIAVLAELRRLKTELVPEHELNKVKQYLSGNLFLEVESTDAQANFLGGQEILTGKPLSPQEIVKKIKAVTSKDLMRLANEIFRTDKLNLALIGPFKNKAEFEKLLKF